MVQLSPSSPGGNGQLSPLAGDPKHQSDRGLGSLQSPLSSAATPLQVYETYIENGFISLKHKIRNIEKKKVKLEDYRQRLNKGEALNQDQLEAVEKYEAVVHNLDFARDLQKVFTALSQDLIKAQKKAFRREHIQKTEAEKKRLCTILQIQYMLQTFCQEHVQQDFKEGMNGALYITSKELDNLSKFSKLLCHKRFKHMSLEDEMDQLSIYLWNLMEGNEKTVAGTNYKALKDLVGRMLDCGYFESVPEPPPPPKKPEVLLKEPPKTETSKSVKADPESFVEHVRLETPPLELPIRHCAPKIEQVPKAAEMPSPVPVTYMKPEAIKPWSVAANVKLQEPPKRWQSPPSLIPLTKPWAPTSVLQPVAPPAKKCELGPPKERRDRAPKPQQEVRAVTPASFSSPKMPPVPSVPITVKKREVPAPICINHPAPAVNNTQPHRVASQPAAEFCYSPTLPKDPELRKQKLEDLIDQIKGTYNFMQDSMLDFDFPSPRSASPRLLIEVPAIQPETIEILKEPVVPAEPIASPPLPMEPPVDPVSPIKSEPVDPPSPVSSPINVPMSPAPKVDEMAVPELIYVPSPPLPEVLPEKCPTPVPLQNEPLQSPKTPTNVPLLPLKREGTPLSTRSTPVSSHTSPFQGMQAIFKVNPPLPTRKEKDLTEDPPYSPEYQQTYSTASTQTLPHGLLDLNGGEPHALIQEAMVGGPYPSGIPPVTNGSVPCYTSTPNLLPRIPQQCITTRGGMIRGASRGARVMTNGYRCQTSFKGLETYRGPQYPSNGSYGLAPCPGRDYPVAQYIPRDSNSHLCHKRGSATPSGRSTSRGWNDSSQMGSPEMEESFNSTDSGQGDSRSMTSVDMSMSGQAATILPVHVYPLPQQMRVAFSTARTSNFAPGTLDQPIVFDLLLNNLGDTFDFQVGRFMCPVNGTYVFIFHMLKLAVNVPLYVNLMKNEEVIVSAYANDGAPDHETASNHAVLQLFQGDQIWLRLHRGAIYGSSWKYSTFSGYLLYQD